LNLGKSKETKKCLAFLNHDVVVQIVSKRQRKKLGRVKQTLGRAYGL
jgi:hypothetical protein